MSVDEFTPKQLTRRMCTSITARKFDPLGKAAPLDLRLKNDLRKIIHFDSDWDKPISSELRSRGARTLQYWKILEIFPMFVVKSQVML